MFTYADCEIMQDNKKMKVCGANFVRVAIQKRPVKAPAPSLMVGDHLHGMSHIMHRRHKSHMSRPQSVQRNPHHHH